MEHPRHLKALFVLVVILAGTFTRALWQKRRLAAGTVADRIRIEKRNRRLILYSRDKIIREYRVALGKQPIGHKQREGDFRTPEGIYSIVGRNPRSKFHRSLKISYPDDAAVQFAKKNGFSPGSDIFIHGIRNGRGWLGRFHRFRDWTAGCIAVTNVEIEEIWSLVPDGTLVEIVP